MRKATLCLWFVLFFRTIINAQSWVPVGGGTNAFVGSLVKYQGKLCVGGNFTKAGTLSVGHVASWNGKNWDSLGSGLKVNVSGDGCYLYAYDSILYAMGIFDAAGNDTAHDIAQWNGTSWDTVGYSKSLSEKEILESLCVYNSEIYAVGSRNFEGNSIMRFHLGKWDTIGKGVNNTSWSLVVYDGKLYVGGYFDSAGGNRANFIATWDGLKWDSVGEGMNEGAVTALAVFQGKLYAGGIFNHAGNVFVNNIAVWNDTVWAPVGSGILGSSPIVQTLYATDSNLYVGGVFNTAGGIPANNIAKWDGKEWSALGLGLNDDVWAIYEYDSTIYAGGWFDSSGSTPVNYIAMFKDTVTGINEITKKNEKVSVYPNPNNGNFTVSMSKAPTNTQIEIFDMVGQVVYKRSLDAAITNISLSDQSTGVYFYRITDANGKLIKADKVSISH